MILTKTLPQTQYHLRFNGKRHAAIVSSGEEEIFEAYFEFAFHHTANDAARYEKAASFCLLGEVKRMFIQLASWKREVLHKLRMNRRASPAFAYVTEKQSASSGGGDLPDAEIDPAIAPLDAFAFAFRKENKTLATYERLADTVTIPSIRFLFDYLKGSQMEQLRFLTAQSTRPYGKIGGPATSRLSA